MYDGLENLKDQNSEEDQVLKDLKEENCQQGSIDAEPIRKYPGGEEELEEQPKEIGELDKNPPEPEKVPGDLPLEKEDKVEENMMEEVLNLEDQSIQDVLESDGGCLKKIENVLENPENKEQLNKSLEDLAEEELQRAQAADKDLTGECSQDSLPDPIGGHTQNELREEQNRENLDRIEHQLENTPEKNEADVTTPEEDLPNEQVTQFLRHLVTQLWPELRANPELRLNRASAKGDNYLGVVWRLQVASESKRSLVVKLPPQNRVRRKQFFARPCFLRETAAYEVFLPLAEMIQKKWKIPGEDSFRQHARCLGTRQDEPNECIVLEDLSCAGFSLHDRFSDLSVEHVRQVIRSYAKLHAISLAGKRQFPERMLKLQQLVDIFEQRREDHALGVYFENLKGSALSSLLSPEDDSYRVRLQDYFARGSYFELLLPLVSGSNCEPFAVICHGDCWNNNILYKRAERGELEDVRLIDWQLMRYASPVTDLSYFLFTCTSRGFRQRYFKDMLEDYYEELGQHLNRLNEQSEQLLPRPAFDEQVATKAAVGLLLAMMVLPIVTMQGQDVPDLQAISERIEAGATTDLQGAGFLGAGNEATFKRRMREVILDCVDFNYI
ncbi:uncharacterized protein LOC108044235 [Drosophila rhopaloa]|uniref:Uncharacterized protein LOC108044235 n=1 Tax=Drosophila rhopaloa TaxID=1041015 RepID=A0A6P4F036_DRORH|nr:uncharacterized protein LOC108044235 [Drosophila rhopaloa]